ncbi:MAG: metallophosphoesterase family protein, partial [Planctomycetaceae bacterium]
MAPVVILHLTDLHFGWTAAADELARRKRCLNALVQQLQQLSRAERDWKPTLVVISGDIGWKGIDSDYTQAHEWLSGLLDAIEVTSENVVACAGNHDINRDAAAVLLIPNDAVDADKVLKPPVHPFYAEAFKAYTNYCQNTAKFRPWRFHNENSWLVGSTELQGIKLLALNTSWYCRGDGDR